MEVGRYLYDDKGCAYISIKDSTRPKKGKNTVEKREAYFQKPA